MAWTTDDVMKLISSMKELPVLHNRDLPQDPDIQAAAIENIQTAVNKPWSVIRKKWSEMRHYHKNLYLTYMQNKRQDKPKWLYYDSMAFAVDSEYRHSSKFDCVLSDDDESMEETSEIASIFNGFDQDASHAASSNVQSLVQNQAKRKIQGKKAGIPLKTKRVASAGANQVQGIASSAEETFEKGDGGNDNIIYVVKDTSDLHSEYLETLGFKLRDIEQKYGQYEANVAGLQLHECICRFEKEAALRKGTQNI